MTLGFSTKWPDRMGELAGQPNYFIEKIWAGMKFDLPIEYSILHNVFNAEHVKKFGMGWDNENPSITRSYIPKLHTIRRDTENRWKAGNDIHFVINNRTKDRFQFAPVVKCVNVQSIEILHTLGHALVKIDGEFFGEIYHYGFTDIHEYTNDLEVLAINDGFPSIEAFFQYFNEDFKGKLIHWTGLKY